MAGKKPPVGIAINPRRPLEQNPPDKEGEFFVGALKSYLVQNILESTIPKDPLESMDPIRSTENFKDQINEIDCEIRKFDIFAHGLEREILSPISNASCDKDPIKSTSELPRNNPLRVYQQRKLLPSLAKNYELAMLERAWAQDPFVVFLAETLADKDKLNKLYDELQFAEKSHEKLGGLPRSKTEMRDFIVIVDECGFMDLGYIGDKFTWKGKRSGGLVLERLDRVLVTNSWVTENPATRVQHLNERGCGDTVKEAWGIPSPGISAPIVSEKIKWFGENLTEWIRRSFWCIHKQLQEKSKLSAKAKIVAALGGDCNPVKLLQLEVNELLDKTKEASDMETIKDLLGVPEIKQYEKYLGFLSFVGCNKKASLVFTKERILSKLQGWKEKLLSQREFQQLRPTHVKIPPTTRSTRWWPPPVGWVKVNFDGSLFPKDCTAGLDIITRNEHVLVMTALSQQILLPTLVAIV
uniref:Uncharacterized protein n=1 Tax=Quercus lobata TaxID=97700 RepID=A0A7N2R7E6_QUELO